MVRNQMIYLLTHVQKRAYLTYFKYLVNNAIYMIQYKMQMWREKLNH